MLRIDHFPVKVKWFLYDSYTIIVKLISWKGLGGVNNRTLYDIRDRIRRKGITKSLLKIYHHCHWLEIQQRITWILTSALEDPWQYSVVSCQYCLLKILGDEISDHDTMQAARARRIKFIQYKPYLACTRDLPYQGVPNGLEIG